MKIIRPIKTTDSATFTRASTGSYFNSAGVLTSAAIDIPRLNYDPTDLAKPPAYLSESAATNTVKNNSMQGLVAGTPGTLPTGWASIGVPAGCTRQLIGSGTESGIDYIDIRCFGTVSSAGQSLNIYPELTTSTVATFGQTLTFSSYVKIVSGTMNGITTGRIGMDEYSSAPAYLTGGSTIFTATAAENLSSVRYSGSRTVSSSSTSYVQGVIYFSMTNGSDIDVTMRIGMPQMEKGIVASTPIRTTSSAVTRAADVMGAGIISNVAEADYPAWSSGTTYALADRVIVVSTSTHLIYESISASNTNHSPASSPTWWELVSATNRHKMFDAAVSSQTINTDIIAASIAAQSRVDSVALINILGTSARITQTTVDGTTYDETRSLVSAAGIVDPYSYCFNQIEYVSDILFEGMPPYTVSTVSVAIEGDGEVRCGACVVGQSLDMGITLKGVRLGMQDYSIKTKDKWGNYSFVEGAFAKRGDFTFKVDAWRIDHIQTTLANYRVNPIVYIGSEKYASMMIFGVYKDFSQDVQYEDSSICSIQIEGLT